MDLFAENRSVSQLSEETLKRYLKPLLSDKSVLKIGHNIKTSMHFIAKFLGTGTDFFPLEDIAVLSYDLDSSEHGHSLDELCGLFLDVTPQKFEELTGTGKIKYLLTRSALNRRWIIWLPGPTMRCAFTIS